MDIRFGTWNIRSLYRIGLLKRAVRELQKNKLDIVGVQEVRQDKGGKMCRGLYIFLWTGEWASSVRDRFFHA
jgi:exonuclease III